MAQINKPSDYFNTVTWTGDGSASRNITGVGFQPDLVWGKCRNTTVSHAVYDSVRGASNLINTNLTSAEGTNAALNAFISDGFTVNSDSYFNGNSNTYVGWNWLASNTTASNTDGSITSTVSANTTSGFSIVSYTGNGTSGATVGHGLGATPKCFIVRRRNSTGGWVVYHEAVGNTKITELHAAAASQTSSAAWNNTSPSSTTFTLGDYTSTNTNGGTYIAYCFAEKNGFSKFGSYTGNGNADGAFIYTGFKPAFVMIKNTATETDWELIDNKRLGYNDLNYRLSPNSSASEQTTDRIADILSNGFKIRNTSTAFNGSGNTMIYMAFAENPLVGTNDIPATAR